MGEMDEKAYLRAAQSIVAAIPIDYPAFSWKQEANIIIPRWAEVFSKSGLPAVFIVVGYQKHINDGGQFAPNVADIIKAGRKIKQELDEKEEKERSSRFYEMLMLDIAENERKLISGEVKPSEPTQEEIEKHAQRLEEIKRRTATAPPAAQEATEPEIKDPPITGGK